MSEFNIQLENIDISEALRYMGWKKNQPDEIILNIVKECETEVLKTIKPRYLYKIFNINEVQEGVVVEDTNLTLASESIKKHLKGCTKAVFLCATLSSDIDKLIRKHETTNMLYAMAIDALSNAAIEQILDIVQEKIKEELKIYKLNFRFGIGYGDLSLSYQKPFLDIMNASKIIGLNVNENNLLTPRKSVTCIMGMKNQLEDYSGSIDIVLPEKKESASGCANCNLNSNCNFKKEGTDCGL